MKKALLLLVSCVAIIGWCGTAKAQWEQANTGLTLNEVNSFATIGNTMFAATGNISGNSQGVFKSMDNGDNWTAVNNGFLTLDVRQIIAVGSTLYAAVAGVNITDGGVYRSTDMGDTWVQASNGLLRKLAYSICHLNGTLYTAINASGGVKAVYTSTDGADNWIITSDQVLNDNHTKSIVTIGGNILLASDGGQGGVYLSTDDGASWSETLPNGADAAAVIGSTAFAALGTGVFKSTDNGVTWTATANSAGVIDNATALAVVGTTLIVATPGGSVYSSDDSGDTWTNVSEGATTSLAAEGFGMDANYLYAGMNFTSVGVYRRALSDFGISPTAPEAPTDLVLTPQKTQLIGQMVLDWTDNSDNEDGFTVERSLDGTNWATIGTSTDPTYTDVGLSDATVYYYQVAAYNGVGTSAYSNIASGSTLATVITSSTENAGMSIFPNPSNGHFTVTFDGDVDATRHVNISNVLGGSVSSYMIAQPTQQIDLSSYPKGMYFLDVREGDTIETRKVIVE